MRLLHTSDWHLGRSFHRQDLLGAQATFVDFLVETVRGERVDVVLVAGDVYDRALPSLDAVRLCNEALRRLRDTGARVVIISGNHDSASRLGFGADLIDAAGIHLRTEPAGSGRPVVLADQHGEVAVYGIPYLEPDAVRAELGCDERSHAAVLGAAMAAVRTDAASRPAARKVVLAHAFVTGAAASESERDISVGGVSVVPASTFGGMGYVALGHLHGPQEIAPGVRYSGSPIAYSFSEERHRKSVTLVDLSGDTGRGLTTTLVETPVERGLSRIHGRLDDLLTESRWESVAGHYLQVTLTDRGRPKEAMERLRQRFAHTLVLAFEPEGLEPTDAQSYASRVSGRSELEVAADFVEHVRSAPDAEEVRLLTEAFERSRLAGASG